MIFLKIVSKTAYLMPTKLHLNVPRLKFSQISSRNIDPLEEMCLVGWAFFPLLQIMESLKISFKTAFLISTKFHGKLPLVNLCQIQISWVPRLKFPRLISSIEISSIECSSIEIFSDFFKKYRSYEGNVFGGLGFLSSYANNGIFKNLLL